MEGGSAEASQTHINERPYCAVRRALRGTSVRSGTSPYPPRSIVRCCAPTIGTMAKMIAQFGGGVHAC